MSGAKVVSSFLTASINGVSAQLPYSRSMKVRNGHERLLLESTELVANATSSTSFRRMALIWD